MKTLKQFLAEASIKSSHVEKMKQFGFNHDDLFFDGTAEMHRNKANELMDHLEKAGYEINHHGTDIDRTNIYHAKHPDISGYVEFKEVPYYDHLARVNIKG